jgi:hypothetical protein
MWDAMMRLRVNEVTEKIFLYLYALWMSEAFWVHCLTNSGYLNTKSSSLFSAVTEFKSDS